MVRLCNVFEFQMRDSGRFYVAFTVLPIIPVIRVEMSPPPGHLASLTALESNTGSS